MGDSRALEASRGAAQGGFRTLMWRKRHPRKVQGRSQGRKAWGGGERHRVSESGQTHKPISQDFGRRKAGRNSSHHLFPGLPVMKHLPLQGSLPFHLPKALPQGKGRQIWVFLPLSQIRQWRLKDGCRLPQGRHLYRTKTAQLESEASEPHCQKGAPGQRADSGPYLLPRPSSHIWVSLICKRGPFPVSSLPFPVTRCFLMALSCSLTTRTGFKPHREALSPASPSHLATFHLKQGPWWAGRWRGEGGGCGEVRLGGSVG